MSVVSSTPTCLKLCLKYRRILVLANHSDYTPIPWHKSIARANKHRSPHWACRWTFPPSIVSWCPVPRACRVIYTFRVRPLIASCPRDRSSDMCQVLEDPWWVLPAEVLHGFTFAAVWAASVSYVQEIAPGTCSQQLPRCLCVLPINGRFYEGDAR